MLENGILLKLFIQDNSNKHDKVTKASSENTIFRPKLYILSKDRSLGEPHFSMYKKKHI